MLGKTAIAAWWIFAICTAAAPTPGHAIDVGLEFDSPQQASRYYELIDELRCLVCQNQNVADSNAALAQDLRQRTYQMIADGQSDQQILDYMTARYGDFVLYRPPLKPATLVLWGAPVIFLLAVALSFWLYIRRAGNQPAAPLSGDDRQRARQLLDE